MSEKPNRRTQKLLVTLGGAEIDSICDCRDSGASDDQRCHKLRVRREDRR